MTVPASPWDRLFADVKISLPGVTHAVYAQELFRCVKDFMDKTNIWQETVTINGLANVLTYSFTVTKGTPNRLLMFYDPATSTNPNFRYWAANASMQVPGVIVIAYPPSNPVSWRAVVAKNIQNPVTPDLQPDIDATSQWIVDKYRDAFFYGTLARLQRQPIKPYTNMGMSKDNMQHYIAERGKARTDAIKMNTFGAQAWTYPQTFATVSRKGWV